MTITVGKNTDLVVPQSVQRQAGIRSGDKVEFRVSGGIIRIIPAPSPSPDEYSPSQRAAIDARLAEARKGPRYGPFDTADQAIRFLGKEIRARKSLKRSVTRKRVKG